MRERHQRPRVPDPSAPLAGTVGDFTALQLIRPILALRFHLATRDWYPFHAGGTFRSFTTVRSRYNLLILFTLLTGGAGTAHV